jgi:uncharacterized protein DUF5335
MVAKVSLTMDSSMDSRDTAVIRATTRQIARGDWQTYFEHFTQEQLADDRLETATIELVSPQRGDQFEAEDARLYGVHYDPKSNAFRVLLENVDHLVFHPTELWVVEEDSGFLRTVELVSADGSRELIHLHRGLSPLAH